MAAALLLIYDQYGSAVYIRGQYLEDMVKKSVSRIRLQYYILSIRCMFTTVMGACGHII